MAVQIEYPADESSGLQGSIATVHGSDGRFNVSARSDGRGYYNSRDESESYIMVFDDAGATANDFVAYLKNTKTDGKHMVIRSIGVNCIAAGSIFKLHTVASSVSPGSGTAVTPVNLNQGGVAKSATVDAQAPTNSNSTPMTLSATVDLIDILGVPTAYGHEEFRLNDQLRLGQDQAIALELEAAAATNVRTWGVIFFYFE